MARRTCCLIPGIRPAVLEVVRQPNSWGSYQVVNLEAIDDGIRLNGDTTVTYKSPGRTDKGPNPLIDFQLDNCVKLPEAVMVFLCTEVSSA
jgi:hypothetical protein